MRRWLVGLLVTVSLLVVVAISASAQEITLTLWENSDPKHMEATLRAIAKFEEENPGIKVDVQPYANQGRLDKLIVSVAAGQGPDVVAFWGADFKWLALEGMWMDLTPYIERYMTEEDLADFFPAQMDFFRIGDMQYALPRYAGTVATLANKTLFDKAGLDLPRSNWDLDDFLYISHKLTQDTSGDGEPDQYGFVFLKFQDRISMSIKRAGGSMQIDGDMRSFGLDLPESIQALEWLQGLMHVERVAPPNGTESRWRLQSGLVGMEENGPWQISPARLDEVPFDLAIIEPPVGPKGPVSYLSTDGYAVVSNTRHPEEAFKLVQFLADTYATELRATVAGLQPARRSVAWAWLDEVQATFPNAHYVDWTVFLRVAEYAEPEPYFHRYADVWSLPNPALTRIWNGEPVGPTIASVADQIRSILAD